LVQFHIFLGFLNKMRILFFLILLFAFILSAHASMRHHRVPVGRRRGYHKSSEVLPKSKAKTIAAFSQNIEELYSFCKNTEPNTCESKTLNWSLSNSQENTCHRKITHFNIECFDFKKRLLKELPSE